MSAGSCLCTTKAFAGATKMSNSGAKGEGGRIFHNRSRVVAGRNADKNLRNFRDRVSSV